MGEAASPCSATYYPLFDHLGTAIILLDGSGNVVYEQRYAPFGQKDKAHTSKKPSNCNNGEEEDSFPYGFTGHFGDEESGLIYMQARYYNPTIGRFITPDNVLPSPTDSLSYDRYAYTRNNPINLIDPTGTFAWAAFWAFVAIGALTGGFVAAINHGNILLGVVTGAISGALTALGAPLGSAGQWSYIAVTQSVNVALHATSGGRWLIQKVGNAIGSQVLGDVLVTALATGAALKATNAGVVNGKTESVSLEQANVKIAELEAKKLQGRLSAEEQSQLNQLGELAKQDFPIVGRLEIGKERFTSGGGTFGGPSVIDMIKEGRVSNNDVTLWFKAASGETSNSAELLAISAAAPVKGISFLQHISVDSTNPAVVKDFGNAEYLISGTCHQTAARGLSRVIGGHISPFDISSNWSVFLTTGLYGYYGAHFILPFKILEAYEYKENH
ncbi:MAG: RHS repeat-associated core domain-containing protein [Thermoanaerobaculaceae bacterium]|nr:RHS repeat-associated core domain-containing protein [Thermoanaerobaculaceae bacterium]